MKNINEIFASLETSILKSNSGISKETIYRKEIFENCISDKAKKQARSKIRKFIDNFLESILTCKDKEKLKKLCIEFDKFYKSVYITNDYSLASISSNNTNETKKVHLQKMLDIVKANVSETKKPTTKKKTEKKVTETKTEANEQTK